MPSIHQSMGTGPTPPLGSSPNNLGGSKQDVPGGVAKVAQAPPVQPPVIPVLSPEMFQKELGEFENKWKCAILYRMRTACSWVQTGNKPDNVQTKESGEDIKLLMGLGVVGKRLAAIIEANGISQHTEAIDSGNTDQAHEVRTIFKPEILDQMRPVSLQRATHDMIKPSLVNEAELNNAADYKRTQGIDEKDTFRLELKRQLKQSFRDDHSFQHFITLAESLKENGAITFTKLINSTDFHLLMTQFNETMENHGSHSVLHSYVNLRKAPEFLCNESFNKAFVHPLLILLISYNVGGPVRVVDARGKHTGPLTAQAQDNMLHIDNTPFNNEYKIILTWKKDTSEGPKGQNFVYIPGTHNGYRNCMNSYVEQDLLRSMLSEDVINSLITNKFIITKGALLTKNKAIFEIDGNEVWRNMTDLVRILKGHSDALTLLEEKAHGWSTENASIFIDDPSVHNVFEVQSGFSGQNKVVSEVTHDDPTTTVFGAGQLVHHRHRTEEGAERSCAIIAFHPIRDNPGSYGSFTEKGSIFGLMSGATVQKFLDTYVTTQIQELEDKLGEIFDVSDESKGSKTSLLDVSEQTMDEDEFLAWKNRVTTAPLMQALKRDALSDTMRSLTGPLSKEKIITSISKIMKFDKHGPLDLILYYDSHEEPRKWARNRIREMHMDDLERRLSRWFDKPQLTILTSDDVLTEQKTKDAGCLILSIVQSFSPGNAMVDKEENITSEEAFKSIVQLVTDLNEAVVRCYDHLNYVSTSLFLFWACDELIRCVSNTDPKMASDLKRIGYILLKNYLASTYLESLQSD